MKCEIVGTSIEAEIEIEAPPQSVFDAMTDPAQLAGWWTSEKYQTQNWKIDLRPGGAWSCDAVNPQGSTTVHGVYTEVDPPRALAFTWNPGWDPVKDTVVRMIFDPVPGGTRVRLFHTGFDGFAESQKGHSQGWPLVLGWLRDKFTHKGAKA